LARRYCTYIGEKVDYDAVKAVTVTNPMNRKWKHMLQQKWNLLNTLMTGKSIRLRLGGSGIKLFTKSGDVKVLPLKAWEIMSSNPS